MFSRRLYLFVFILLAGSGMSLLALTSRVWTVAAQGQTFENLTSGSPVTGFIAAPPQFNNGVLGQKEYIINVPSGSSQLSINLSGDQVMGLYVRFNQAVTGSGQTFAADYHSSNGTGGQSLTITSASSPALQAGNYDIGVVNFGGGAANFTLTATVSNSSNQGSIITLTSGSTATGSIVAPATFNDGILGPTQYVINVPSGATQLSISMFGNQVLGLYIRFNQPVTGSGQTFAADYSANDGSGSHTISVTSGSSPPLQAGNYYIAIVNDGGGAANYTVMATITGGTQSGVIQLTSGSNVNGSVPANGGGAVLGATQYEIAVPAGATLLQVNLNADQNVDLYVRLGQAVTGVGAAAVADLKAQGNGGSESLSITNTGNPPLQGGNYFIGVGALSGNATNYTLSVQVTGGASTCTFAINPTALTFPLSGGTGTVVVTAPAGCTWTAVSNASFATITAGSTGTGNGSVGFTVASSAVNQTGTLTIAGQTFTITQSGASNNCTFSINPTAISFTLSGGIGNVIVTAGTGCTWTAVSNAAFAVITAGSSGSGNGSVSFTVASSNVNQTGTLTIAGQTLTITQSGASSNCTFVISPTSQNFTLAGGSGSVTVTTTTGCTWTAVSNFPGAVITSGSSGSGNGQVNFTVASSNTNQTGTLTIAGQTFTINQTGSSSNCTFTISPTSQAFTVTGGNGSINVTTTAGCAWTAVSNNPFITVNTGSTGTGSGTVTFSVAATTSSNRVGSLTVAGKTFTVTQTGGCSFSLNPIGQVADYVTTTGSITVNTQAGCSWTTVNNSSFISLTSSGSGTGTGTVNYAITSNTGFARTGTLTIAGQTFTVQQAAAPGFSGGGNCPTITSLSTSTGSAGTSVTINGANLTGVTAVSFGGNVAATFTIVNDNQISATVPAGAQSGAITVSKPGCGSFSTGQFTIFNCGSSVSVSLPTNLLGTTGALTIPITVSNLTGLGILSYDFTLNYDIGTFQPQAVAFDQTGTLSAGMTVVANTSVPGQIRVSAFTTTPLSGSGTLLNLKFNMIGGNVSCSNLTWASFKFNEGNVCAVTANGSVCGGGPVVSGSVSYAVLTKPVPGVVISAAGSVPKTATTDVNGNYQLTNLGTGAYKLTPAKTGDVNGITALDAAMVAQFAAGLITLTPAQLVAADASNDGTVSSFDAALIAQTAVGITNSGIAGTWKFLPPSISFTSLASNQLGQNFGAVLVGDVSGNWQSGITSAENPGAIASAAESATVSDAPVTVALMPTSNAINGDLTIPVTVGDLTGKGVISFDFDLTYDPTILQPQGSGIDNTGSLANSLSVISNAATPGRLRVAGFGVSPIAGAGTLLSLKFKVISASVSATTVTWQSFSFNEGQPSVALINGQVTVSAPCSYSVSFDKRSFSALGGSGTLHISTGSSCQWSVSDNTPWLQINSAMNGAGSADLSFTVPSSNSIRAGTVVIAGQTYAITQSGDNSVVAYGDLNGDGVVDASDLVLLANILAGNVTANIPAADVFLDGTVNAADLVTLANFLAGNISSLPVVPNMARLQSDESSNPVLAQVSAPFSNLDMSSINLRQNLSLNPASVVPKRKSLIQLIEP